MGIPLIFILILNWNGWHDTVECLESVQRLSYPNYRIVVIDNGSTDGSVERIKAWAAGELPVESKFFTYDPSTKPVRWIEYDRATAEAGGLPELEAEIEALPPHSRIAFIQTGANLGYAGGNNVGIRYALARGANYVWLLNNDTVVDKNALTEMVRLAESDEKIGMVGSKILRYDSSEVILDVGGWLKVSYHIVHKFPGYNEIDRGQWDKVFQPDYLNGASLLVSTLAIRDIGLLDEEYFLYWEETDCCYRARRNGKGL